jgi:hypothetical protein
MASRCIDLKMGGKGRQGVQIARAFPLPTHVDLKFDKQ